MLVTSRPLTVTNVRRDEYNGRLDFSFLVFGTFDLRDTQVTLQLDSFSPDVTLR